jgi:hypothetical protein
MNGMDTIGNIFFILLISEILLFGAAIVKIGQYVEERGLVPWWRILTGLVAPWNVISLYVNHTKMESSRIGIWLTISIVSFCSTITTALLLALI